MCQVSHELTRAPQLISFGDLDPFNQSKKDKAFFLGIDSLILIGFQIPNDLKRIICSCQLISDESKGLKPKAHSLFVGSFARSEGQEKHLLTATVQMKDSKTQCHFSPTDFHQNT